MTRLLLDRAAGAIPERRSTLSTIVGCASKLVGDEAIERQRPELGAGYQL